MTSESGGDGLEQSEIVPLRTIAREWLRLGCIGFGGPPTHIALLRRLCIEERGWLDAKEFEDAIATTNLLPVLLRRSWRSFAPGDFGGPPAPLVGGLCFVVPGLVLILGLSSVFLASHPPEWVLGAAAGAGAAVPAVALSAAWRLVPASRNRMGAARSRQVRWALYALVGAVAAAILGAYLVLVVMACGLAEVAIRRRRRPFSGATGSFLPVLLLHGTTAGGLGALAWVSLKVGALSYGGGFVIVPLMQHDAVVTYHWMTGAQFLNAIALGQVTPGPVVQTMAVVGYAAGGLAGGLLAALIVFAPSFLFIMIGAPHFDQIRANSSVESFLTGAGPAVIGAIAGSAIPLGLTFQHLWQLPILAGALVWLFAAQWGVVSGLLLAGAVGILVALSGSSRVTVTAPPAASPRGHSGSGHRALGIRTRNLRSKSPRQGSPGCPQSRVSSPAVELGFHLWPVH